MHANDERENRVYLSGPQGSKEVCKEDKNEYHDKVCHHINHGLKRGVGQ